MRLLRTVTGIVLWCGLVACGSSPPVHYYTLEPVAVPVTSRPAQQDAVVGIGAIHLPAYLDRLPIVRREGAALTFDNTERWAEPLDDAVPRVLAANLTAQLPEWRIVRGPWSNNSKPEWKLTVNIERFELEAGQVVLQASWSLQDRNGKLLLNRQLQLWQSCEGHDSAAIAKAHSQLLLAFGAAVADQLRALPRN